MGLELHFLSPPPLTFVPPARAMPGATQLPLIRPFIPVLLSRHIIRKIATPQLLYFSRVFVVGKKNNSSRLVIDLSLLNLLLIVPRFKMETGEDCPQHHWSDVGMHNRHGGRVFPRPRGMGLSEVSGICGGQPDIRLSVPPFRSGICPLGLLQGYQTDKGFPSSFDGPDSLLSGRLPPSTPIARRFGGDNFLSPGSLQEAGLLHKSPEVESLTLSEGGLSGRSLPSGHASALTSGGEDPLHLLSLSGHGPEFPPFPPTDGEPIGPSELGLISCPSRSAAPSPSPQMDERELLSCHERPPRSTASLLHISPGGMAGSFLPWDPGSDVHSYSLSSADDGCLLVRLEWSPSPSQGLRWLASSLRDSFHQLAGTQGYFPLHSALSSSAPELLSPYHVRQLHCGVLHSSPGFSEVGPSIVPHLFSSGVLSSPLHHPSSQTLVRCFERFGRPGLPLVSCIYRVVS